MVCLEEFGKLEVEFDFFFGCAGSLFLCTSFSFLQLWRAGAAL